MEVVHIGTTGERDSEILTSKWYGPDSDGSMGVPHGSETVAWTDTMSNDRFLYGDRLRLKAPKIEFHLQPSNAYYDAQKYSEQPIITITSQDPGLVDNSSFPPRFLTNIRSGSTTSTKYAGLRLTSASTNTWNGDTHGMPSDGDYYTFTPANDGWLRLYGGASGQGNMTGNYAGLQVGNLYINGTATATMDVVVTSDRRLKTDIKRIEGALDKLTKINGYTYTHNEQASSGCMAQEVKEVLPEVVRGSEDTVYALAYGNMAGLIIEAIKELKSEIDELKSSHATV